MCLYFASHAVCVQAFPRRPAFLMVPKFAAQPRQIFVSIPTPAFPAELSLGLDSHTDSDSSVHFSVLHLVHLKAPVLSASVVVMCYVCFL